MTQRACFRAGCFALCAALIGPAEIVVGGADAMLFTDQTVSAGLVADHDPSVWLLLSDLNVVGMLGGGAIGDFNNDGFVDVLFLTSGGGGDKLFINAGDGTFDERAAEWGIDYAHMGVGTAVGDYDGDGWRDIYITSLGPAVGPPAPGHHLLYHNNGDGTFTDVADTAGVTTTCINYADGFGAVFGDYDLDGDLDLMVLGWSALDGTNRLFQNNGDGTFADATAAAGLAVLDDCRGFSPRFMDMNGDRFPELLIVGDFGTSYYLINNQDGTFTDFTVKSGTGLDGNGMGQTVGDFDGDGLIDWYVTSIYSPLSYLPGVPGTGNMLYRNLGNHFFAEHAVAAGVDDGGWGWGTVAADFDHDGLLDIAETNGWSQENGHAGPEWVNEPVYLFRNLGNGAFEDVAQAAGLNYDRQGRGLAGLDYDNDGDEDLLIFGYDEALVLLRNDVSIACPECHWLRVRLDTASRGNLAPDGFGSRVSVSVGGTAQVRFIDGGSSYLTQSEPSAHFGLGSATIVDELQVLWNDGAELTLYSVAADQIITIGANMTARTGDFDNDGDVDLRDVARFQTCFDPPSDSAQPECEAADFNADNRIDLIDFAVFATMMDGV